ncbi:MAG TPA: hypothetical protein PK736_04305, partial [Bacteroidia bacterium]|nr:hypothetical protein [Bacteroidia bacterium]
EFSPTKLVWTKPFPIPAFVGVFSNKASLDEAISDSKPARFLKPRGFYAIDSARKNVNQKQIFF